MTTPAVPVRGVAQFERFFRVAAGLDVDKDDLKRFVEFENKKIYDLLLLARAKAEANDRGAVEPVDLPIAKGLQECIHRFRAMEEAADVEGLLADLVRWRPPEAVLTDETEARLPRVAGGIAVALAQTFRIIDSRLDNPSTEHWERAFRVFDLLL